MSLTPKQRAEINRRNAAKSTGPRTDDGKAASRRNATKHGLRAEVVAMPNEDPDVAAARSEAWNDYYRPQSPAAQHFVNECVAATLLSDRCNKYHNAALSEQVRKAERAWDAQRADSVHTLSTLIALDPSKAVHKLKQTAHGLRWMIGEWTRLLAALVDCERWTDPELWQAVRLLGCRPEPEHMREGAPAWYFRFLNHHAHQSPDREADRLLMRDEFLANLPDGEYHEEENPDRDLCRKRLRELVVEVIERLKVDEAVLNEFDKLDRAESAERALILNDPLSARLFLRYHSEARNSFHRSYAALLKTLERDAETSASAPSEADSPSEADPDAKPECETQSLEPDGPPTGPDVSPSPPQSPAPSPQPALRREKARVIDGAGRLGQPLTNNGGRFIDREPHAFVAATSRASCGGPWEREDLKSITACQFRMRRPRPAGAVA